MLMYGSAAADNAARLLKHSFIAEAEENHVHANTVGKLRNNFLKILLAAVNNIFAAELAGHFEVYLGHIRRYDELRAVKLSADKVAQADRAAADDRHGALRRDVCTAHGIDAVCYRLYERTLFIAYIVGKLDDGFFGHDDVFAHGSRPLAVIQLGDFVRRAKHSL